MAAVHRSPPKGVSPLDAVTDGLFLRLALGTVDDRLPSRRRRKKALESIH